MKFIAPGRFPSSRAFADRLRELDPEFGCDLELEGRAGPLGQSLDIGHMRIGNRFATHPMEGWDGTAEGAPSEHTLRRWRRFGMSGAKLIWGGEAYAVQEDGRGNEHQLYHDPEHNCGRDLERLIESVQDGHRSIGEDLDDLSIGLQLTHSGRFSRYHGRLAPKIGAHNPLLDSMFEIDASLPIVSDIELDTIGESFIRSAKLAQEVGFDFVDIKCCHGYLLHELLGARGRPGQYGGSFENRTRFFRTLIADLRRDCPDLALAVRVSIAELVPFGNNPESGHGEPLDWHAFGPYSYGFGVDESDPYTFDLTEPLAFLELLRSLDIRLVNLTLGSPYYCAHLSRPAAYPPSDSYMPPHDPLEDVLRHLRTVRTCKQTFPELVLVGTGYTYLQEYLGHVAQHEIRGGHVDVVGLGRMMLSYPEIIRDVLDGRELDKKRICRTFGDCTTAPRNGLLSGCFPLDAYYKALPDATRLKAIKRGDHQ